MNKTYLGVLLVASSAAGFGLMPIFAIYAYQVSVSVTTLLFFRFLLAIICFLAVIIYRHIDIRQALTKIKSLTTLGILYALVATLYFLSVKYISASLAVLIFYTYPILVVILSLFIEKQALKTTTLFAVLLSSTGLLLTLGITFHSLNPLGIFLALTSAFFYACYIILSNHVVKDLNSLVISTFVTIVTCIAMLILGISTNTLHMVYSPQGWYSIIGISIISTVMSLLTFFYGLNLLGSTRAAIISTVEPLITISFSALLFGETLSVSQYLGALAVLAGAIFSIYAGQKTTDSQQKDST